MKFVFVEMEIRVFQIVVNKNYFKRFYISNGSNKIKEKKMENVSLNCEFNGIFLKYLKDFL